MAVTAFVWLPRDQNVGHSSLSGPNFYVSWWPSAEPGPNGRDGFFFTGMRGTRNSMAEDTRLEGRGPDYASAPIGGLDETKIAEFWNRVSCRPPNDASALPSERMAVCKPDEYAIFNNNCSAMVVRALGAGGAWKNLKFRTIVASQVVITPRVVRDCAEVLNGAWVPTVTNLHPTVNIVRTIYEQLVY